MDDDTYHYIYTLYHNKHPHHATYQREAICVLLLRTVGGKQEVAQHWLTLYTYQDGTAAGNFQYVTRFVKALRTLQERGGFNAFLSNYTFHHEPDAKQPYRRVQANTYRVQCVGVDLDFNKLPRFAGMPYEQAIATIEAENRTAFAVLHPMIVRSGGGCQLYVELTTPLLLSRVENGEAVDYQEGRVKFAALSSALNKCFADYGADNHCRADSARVFRCPGLVSLKYDAPREVSILRRGKAVTYGAAQRFLGFSVEQEPLLLPTTPQAACPKPKQKGRVVTPDFSGYDTPEPAVELGPQAYQNIVQTRRDDLMTALALRNYDIKGHRNEFLFCYATVLYAAIKEPQTLYNALLAVNRTFAEPITEGEVADILDNVLTRHQQLSNLVLFERLYRPLGFTGQELKGCYTAEAQRAAQRKHNQKFYGRRRRKVYSRTEKTAYTLAHPSLSAVEIAAALGCDPSTIRRIRQAQRAA